jgi:hypothetical protein
VEETATVTRARRARCRRRCAGAGRAPAQGREPDQIELESDHHSLQLRPRREGDDGLRQVLAHRLDRQLHGRCHLDGGEPRGRQLQHATCLRRRPDVGLDGTLEHRLLPLDGLPQVSQAVDAIPAAVTMAPQPGLVMCISSSAAGGTPLGGRSAAGRAQLNQNQGETCRVDAVGLTEFGCAARLCDG